MFPNYNITPTNTVLANEIRDFSRHVSSENSDPEEEEEEDTLLC